MTISTLLQSQEFAAPPPLPISTTLLHFLFYIIQDRGDMFENRYVPLTTGLHRRKRPCFI